MRVDKAGGDVFPRGVDFHGRVYVTKRADIVDLISHDGKIGVISGLSRTVNDAAVSDDDIRCFLVKGHCVSPVLL